MRRPILLPYLVLMNVILLICAVFSGCSQKQVDSLELKPEDVDLKAIATEQLGPGSKMIHNEDRQLVLCVQTNEPITHFMVINIQGLSVLSKRKVRGKVKWHSNAAIEVAFLPGVIEDKSSKPSDYIEIIGIKEPH